MVFALVCSSVVQPDVSSAAVKAKKITLNKTKLSMYVGEKAAIKVKKVTPKKAGKAVKYKSGNKSIATVTKKGVVTAVSAGNTKITVTAKSNKKVKKTVKVTVKNKTGEQTPQAVQGKTLSDNTLGQNVQNTPQATNIPGGNNEPVKTPTATPDNTKKDENDVSALQKIIKEQRELGATVSEDINNSDEYTWENGRLVKIDWYIRDLKNSLKLLGLTALKELNCSANQITDLDVSQNTNLEKLICSANNITSLNVNNNTSLKYLDCGYCSLNYINLTGCTALEELRCADNHQIESLIVSGCKSLILINCCNNQITSLDVSECLLLEQLFCSRNQLVTLNISGCSSLYDLTCYGNQLTELDVTDCIELDKLECEENRLTSLNISNNLELRVLNCNFNQIKNIDVRNNSKLFSLICDPEVNIIGKENTLLD